jgi:uncharacterized membrane protein YraQ (UPF0718 family)
MDMVIFWIGGVTALMISFIFNRGKTWKGVRSGLRMFLRILPDFLIVLAAAALFLAVVPETVLSHWIGRGSGIRGFAAAALAGSVALVPGFIAFPLAAVLLKSGASLGSVAVFITTLMMVGIFTLPVEKQYFGWRISILRNGLSFLGALIVGFCMGCIL